MSVSSPETRPALSASEGAGLLAKPDSDTVLEVKGLVKEYPGTRALDGVDLQIHRGEIHALLGENGAGKSTLIRLICGATRPTEGQILFEGRLVELNSPQQAQDLGVAVVHQHFNLVPQLSVAENLFLSQTLPRRVGLFVNWTVIEKRAAKLLDRVGLKINPWTEVSGLRPDENAMVAIAKAIGSDARIIILDEPDGPDEVHRNQIGRLEIRRYQNTDPSRTGGEGRPLSYEEAEAWSRGGLWPSPGWIGLGSPNPRRCGREREQSQKSEERHNTLQRGHIIPPIFSFVLQDCITIWRASRTIGERRSRSSGNVRERAARKRPDCDASLPRNRISELARYRFLSYKDVGQNGCRRGSLGRLSG